MVGVTGTANHWRTTDAGWSKSQEFVPNNDLDAVGGDPGRIGEIRTPKLIKPILFDSTTALLYVWTFDDTAEAGVDARQVCAITNQLYQLGRGVDMAWARAEILGAEEAEARLDGYKGSIYRPSTDDGGTMLAVPLMGSLVSLIEDTKKWVRASTPSTSQDQQEGIPTERSMPVRSSSSPQAPLPAGRLRQPDRAPAIRSCRRENAPSARSHRLTD